LLALVKLFKRQSTNFRTSSLSYNVQLKIEFFDKNKVLKNSNIQTINLNANTWANGIYQLPTIQDHTIFYVKFSIINPNTFVVYLDNWKIEEKGKVILQENHYYPYGKEIVSLGRKGSPNHEFTFSGKEDNEEFGWDRYDFGARTLGEDFPRWNTVDAMAEKAVDWSPYRYAFCNPLTYTDKDGNFELDPKAQGYKHLVTILKNIESQQSNQRLVTAFSQYSGLDEQQTKDMFKYGQGSLLKVADIKAKYGNDPNGITVDADDQFELNGEIIDVRKSDMVIDVSLVNKLENVGNQIDKFKSMDNLTEKDSKTLSKLEKQFSKLSKQVEAFILHEGVHSGDIKKNDKFTDADPKTGERGSYNGVGNKKDSGYERGEDFENHYYGDIISVDF
jgi:RHS repeat-associated protein